MGCHAHPNNDPFRSMCCHHVDISVGAVSLESDDQLKVSLVRVRFPLLTHVVRRCLAEVQPTDRQFVDLVSVEINPKEGIV